jgi:hypothetical protein
MDVINRLTAAQDAAEAGRYAEALNEYIWFHHHALEEDRMLCVVRTSYALTHWMALAGKYPPARKALQEIRNEKSQRLAAGIPVAIAATEAAVVEAMVADHKVLFDDVAAINEFLGNEEATYDLFCTIVARDRDFAAQCERRARPALIKANDFKLARSLIDSFDKEAGILALMLNRGIERLRRNFEDEMQGEVFDSEMQYFVDTVHALLRIFVGANPDEDADALCDCAVAQIEDKNLRESMRKKLSPPS